MHWKLANEMEKSLLQNGFLLTVRISFLQAVRLAVSDHRPEKIHNLHRGHTTASENLFSLTARLSRPPVKMIFPDRARLSQPPAKITFAFKKRKKKPLHATPF